MLPIVPSDEITRRLHIDRANFRAKQSGRAEYSLHEQWQLLGLCQLHGLFDLLAAHGARPLPYDLREDGEMNPFDVQNSSPIDVEPAQPPTSLGNMPTSIAGFRVGFPIGVPASVLASNSRWVLYFARRGFDVLTYKTVRSIARDPHSYPNWVFLEDGTEIRPPFERAGRGYPGLWPAAPRQASMVNSFGVPSERPEWWQDDIRRLREQLDGDQKLLIVSVLASDNVTEAALVEDFVHTASLAKDAGAQVVEANFSCPNTPGELAGELYQDPDKAARVARAMREALDGTPLFVKIGYLPPALLRRFFDAVHPHVHGIVAINTISVPVFDSTGKQTFPGEGRLTAGISGHAIKRWAQEVCRHLVQLRREYGLSADRLALIGIGGVLTKDDAYEYLRLGVDAVQSCTGAFLNPSLAIETRTEAPDQGMANVTVRDHETLQAEELRRDSRDRVTAVLQDELALLILGGVSRHGPMARADVESRVKSAEERLALDKLLAADLVAWTGDGLTITDSGSELVGFIRERVRA